MINNSTFIFDNKRSAWSKDKIQYLNSKQIEAINRGVGSAIANGIDLDICKALFINNASSFTIK